MGDKNTTFTLIFFRSNCIDLIVAFQLLLIFSSSRARSCSLSLKAFEIVSIHDASMEQMAEQKNYWPKRNTILQLAHKFCLFLPTIQFLLNVTKSSQNALRCLLCSWLVRYRFNAYKLFSQLLVSPFCCSLKTLASVIVRVSVSS